MRRALRPLWVLSEMLKITKRKLQVNKFDQVNFEWQQDETLQAEQASSSKLELKIVDPYGGASFVSFCFVADVQLGLQNRVQFERVGDLKIGNWLDRRKEINPTWCSI